MNQTYDVIVVGLGAMGSATAAHLVKRGANVLGLEKSESPHVFGSSGGVTRLIRKAYFEDPSYVPLLERAYELWSELEGETGEKIFTQSGLLLASTPGHPTAEGTIESATRYGIPLERIAGAELTKRFPWLRCPPHFIGLFEPTAGYLKVYEAISGFLKQAETKGATLKSSEPMLKWSASPKGVKVTTRKRTYEAEKLILCAGAWMPQHLGVDLMLDVQRVPIFWFEGLSSFTSNLNTPCFAFALPNGFFYGFRSEDGTVKIGWHRGQGHLENPDDNISEVREEDLAPLRTFIRTHLPGVTTNVTGHLTCMYTMAPDEHFIIGNHPNHANVVIASACSGHGFKFSPVIGEILTQLALDGATPHPIEFLSPLRESLKRR